MKIKIFLLFLVSLIFASCMKKELVLVCEEDFLNNKIYMNIINDKEVKIKISYADYVYLFSEDGSLKENIDSESIVINATYSKNENEAIIYNEKIKLSMLFLNEQECTMVSENGVIIKFKKKDR